MNEYQKRYVEFKFERLGLFELIHAEYNPVEALYPGCSFHITPLFFFPHVVFIDNDPQIESFFSNQEFILDLAGRHRRYRRTPHFKFVAQDFTTILPIRRNQFDLLLALYTGGVSKACSQYLRRGGILVTSNHHGDAVEAASNQDLSIVAVISKKQDRYHLNETGSFEFPQNREVTSRSKRYLRRSSRGFEYIDDEIYYVFKRMKRFK